MNFFSIRDALRDLVPFVQFKNVKNTHGGVLLLVRNTPPWVFITFFKIVQMVPNPATHHMCFNLIIFKLKWKFNLLCNL